MCPELMMNANVVEVDGNGPLTDLFKGFQEAMRRELRCQSAAEGSFSAYPREGSGALRLCPQAHGLACR